MRLSKSHANQQTISYRDFSGGLNTTDATESIAKNELAKAVNVCLDKSTGLLKTIAGTDELIRDDTKTFDVLMADPWTGEILVTDVFRKVYSAGIDSETNEWTLVDVGTLTNTPSHCSGDSSIVSRIPPW